MTSVCQINPFKMQLSLILYFIKHFMVKTFNIQVQRGHHVKVEDSMHTLKNLVAVGFVVVVVIVISVVTVIAVVTSVVTVIVVLLSLFLL